MLVSGVFEDGWMNATGDERVQAYRKLIAYHREWQALGARLICTMDDLTSAGRPGSDRANFYEVWEIPSPDNVHDLLEGLWSNKDGLALTAHFSLRISVGTSVARSARRSRRPRARCR
jgi:hypothetical protein